MVQQAQKELTQHDVSFHFNERKQGKKVIAIQFVFKNSWKMKSFKPTNRVGVKPVN